MRFLKTLRVVQAFNTVFCAAMGAVAFGNGQAVLGAISLACVFIAAFQVRNLSVAIKMEEAEAERKSDFTKAIEEAEAEADRAKVRDLFRKKGD